MKIPNLQLQKNKKIEDVYDLNVKYYISRFNELIKNRKLHKSNYEKIKKKRENVGNQN